MKDKIAKDRQLLLIFCLIWVSSTLWIMHYYPIIKDFDFSKLSSSQQNILFLSSAVNLFSITMASIYVYKMYKWYNSPNAPAGLITALFVISCLLFGLISLVIVGVIVWKSKKMLSSDKK